MTIRDLKEHIILKDFDTLITYTDFEAKYQDLELITNNLTLAKNIFDNIYEESKYLINILKDKKTLILELLKTSNHSIGTRVITTASGTNSGTNTGNETITNSGTESLNNRTSDNNSANEEFIANTIINNLTERNLTNDVLKNLKNTGSFENRNETVTFNSSTADDIRGILNDLDVDEIKEKYLIAYGRLFTLSFRKKIETINPNQNIQDFFNNLNYTMLAYQNQLQQLVNANINDINTYKIVILDELKTLMTNKLDELMRTLNIRIQEEYWNNHNLITIIKNQISQNINNIKTEILNSQEILDIKTSIENLQNNTQILDLVNNIKEDVKDIKDNIGEIDFTQTFIDINNNINSYKNNQDEKNQTLLSKITNIEEEYATTKNKHDSEISKNSNSILENSNQISNVKNNYLSKHEANSVYTTKQEAELDKSIVNQTINRIEGLLINKIDQSILNDYVTNNQATERYLSINRYEEEKNSLQQQITNNSNELYDKIDHTDLDNHTTDFKSYLRPKMHTIVEVLYKTLYVLQTLPNYIQNPTNRGQQLNFKDKLDKLKELVKDFNSIDIEA